MDKHQHGPCESTGYACSDINERPVPHAVPAHAEKQKSQRRWGLTATTIILLLCQAVDGQAPSAADMLRTNAEFRKSLRPQLYSAALSRAAQNHADYMARTGDFEHRWANGTPGTRAAKAGYDGVVSENLARGYHTINDVFNAWKKSQSHWDSVQADYQEVGFGFAIADDGTRYWVVVYGTPTTTPAYPAKVKQ